MKEEKSKTLTIWSISNGNTFEVSEEAEDIDENEL